MLSPRKEKIGFNRQELRLTESAVLNWARWSGVKDKTPFIEARSALLSELDKVSAIYPAAVYPDWMSQEKPGVEFWLYLPGSQVVLALNKTEQEEYKYIATSALAPKSVRRVGNGDLQLTRPEWKKTELSRLEKMDSKKRSEKIRVSNHACERIWQRLPEFCKQKGIESFSKDTIEDLRKEIALLLAEGSFLPNAEQWANGANKKKVHPVVVVSWNKEEIAFPLSIDPSPESKEKYCATTAIPKSWSLNTLFGLSGEELLEVIYISDKFSEEEYQEIVETILSVKEVEKEGQPALRSKELIIYLRPASAAQRSKSGSNKIWTIDSIERRAPIV